MAIQATGAAEIALVAAACRREANGRLILADMAKEIRKEAGKTIRTELRAAALAKYPKRGGLTHRVRQASSTN